MNKHLNTIVFGWLLFFALVISICYHLGDICKCTSNCDCGKKCTCIPDRKCNSQCPCINTLPK